MGELYGYEDNDWPKKEELDNSMDLFLDQLKSKKLEEKVSVAHYGSSYTNNNYLEHVSDVDMVILFQDEFQVNAKTYEQVQSSFVNAFAQKNINKQISIQTKGTISNPELNTYGNTYLQQFKEPYAKVIFGKDFFPTMYAHAIKSPDQHVFAWNTNKIRQKIFLAPFDELKSQKELAKTYQQVADTTLQLPRNIGQTFLKAKTPGQYDLLDKVEEFLAVDFSLVRTLRAIREDRNQLRSVWHSKERIYELFSIVRPFIEEVSEKIAHTYQSELD